jgi:hypothetical protein
LFVQFANEEERGWVDHFHAKFICASMNVTELVATGVYTVVFNDQPQGGRCRVLTRQLEFVDIEENFARFVGINIVIPRIQGIMIGDTPPNKRKMTCPCCTEEIMFDGIKLQRLM